METIVLAVGMIPDIEDVKSKNSYEKNCVDIIIKKCTEVDIREENILYDGGYPVSDIEDAAHFTLIGGCISGTD